MDTNLYLSLIPESLVVSMLAPERFGAYLATGTQKRARGEAIYFDLKPDFESDYFDLAASRERCVAHPDGQPKHSVYLAIYRVLEHVPLEAVNDLWLATRDGRVLRLQQGEPIASASDKYHLYQELAPVHPLVVSSLDPAKFCRFITDQAHPVHVPRLCFVDLELRGLSQDPTSGDDRNLPYPEIGHIRDCLRQLSAKEKPVKTVNRIASQEVCYRCIKHGFCLGDRERMLFFPFPSHEQLDARHHDWWRSANM